MDQSLASAPRLRAASALNTRVQRATGPKRPIQLSNSQTLAFSRRDAPEV
jgi:hypothetical protein